MKNLLALLLLLLATKAMAYTRWTVINPSEVCFENEKLVMKTMVNTAAGFELHYFDREFMDCQVIDGKIVLDMNLYHRSGNNMEAGMIVKRKLNLPRRFCEGSPDLIRFNTNPDEVVRRNGKFRGPRELKVKSKCSNKY